MPILTHSLLGSQYKALERQNKIDAEERDSRIEALEEMNAKLQNDFLAYQNNIETEETHLRNSAAYSSIKEKYSNNKALTEQDFNQLEQTVTGVNPLFISKISVFCSDEIDKRLCLLLKYRVKPSEIASLICSSRPNITKKRIALAGKVFGKEIDFSAKDFDRYIEYL